MKLAGALVVPLVALLIVTAMQVSGISSEVDKVYDQASLARSSLGLPSLVTQLEYERDVASIYLIGQEGAVALLVEDNAEARRNVDDTLEAFRADIEDRDDDLGSAYGPALDELAVLPDLRARVDAYEGERSLANVELATEIFNAYTEPMRALWNANRQVTVSVENQQLRRGVELADLSARQTDVMAQLVRDLLFSQATGDADGVNTPEEINRVARSLATVRANEKQIRLKAVGEYEPLAEALLTTDHIVEFPRLAEEALLNGRVDMIGVLNNATGPDADSFGYIVFRRAVDHQLEADARQIEADARARWQRYAILAALAFVVAVAVTWLVSRSITKPLRSLTRQAKDMSHRGLPNAVLSVLETPLGDDVEVPETQPITIRTRDEVGDVALALNTVQDAAVELAVEQAVLRRNIADSFVNLGRRNQNLLGRQLDFITELESNETNPDTLSSLFRLDHLATRMRRNAESLLVLAGIDPPRKWAAPVRLTDVIRAALGEVEDYQRVTVRHTEPATILGSAAADLAHLIAEFIENALTFSPPDQSVEIHGTHHTNGYTLAIIDNGFGMPTDDITQANRRLAGAESFTIAPSKYLGHYVAGNLAARHNIHLQLAPTPGTGITATINIPAALLTTDTPTPDRTPAHPRQAKAGISDGGRQATTGTLTGELAAIGTSPVATLEPPARAVGAVGLLGTFGTGGGPAQGGSTGPTASPGPTGWTGPASAVGRVEATGPAGLVGPARTPASSAPPAGQARPSGPAAPPERSWAARGGPTVPFSPSALPTGSDRTPGGLAKRAPRGPAPAARNDPSIPDDLLANLARHHRNLSGPARHAEGRRAQRDRRPERPTAPQAAAPAWAAPAAPAPSVTTSGLARRVRGANLPTADLPPVRRGHDHSGPDADRRSAEEVYGFLRSFTTGVQRGLDDARRSESGDR